VAPNLSERPATPKRPAIKKGSDDLSDGRPVDVADTRLFVSERGDPAAFPLIALHGGPGLDHHMFADYLDPIAHDGRYRLILVDERAQGRSDRSAPPETWTIAQLAADVNDLAQGLGLSSFAVLGHSFGSFLALQHAVDFPGQAAATIVSSGVASARWLAGVADELATFEPVELRQQVSSSWEREASVQTREQVATLWVEQLPFHFADPLDPRLGDYNHRSAETEYAPEVLRAFAAAEYGGIDLEDRLATVPGAVLVLAGRHDRTCSVEAAQDMASRLPRGELVVFENSAHMSFVEQPDQYAATVIDFLDRHV
jgi:proline iminopeptidase